MIPKLSCSQHGWHRAHLRMTSRLRRGILTPRMLVSNYPSEILHISSVIASSAASDDAAARLEQSLIPSRELKYECFRRSTNSITRSSLMSLYPTETSMSSCERVPKEIWLLIFSFLEPLTLFSASQVSTVVFG